MPIGCVIFGMDPIPIAHYEGSDAPRIVIWEALDADVATLRHVLLRLAREPVVVALHEQPCFAPNPTVQILASSVPEDLRFEKVPYEPVVFRWNGKRDHRRVMGP